MHSALSVPRIMWLALLSSQCLYAVLLYVPGLIEFGLVAPPLAVRFALAAAALTVAVASFVVPRILWNAALKQTSYRAPTDVARQHDDEALRQGMKLGMAPFIIGLALNEGVAVLGFVLGFMGEHWLFTSPFFVLAIVLMFARVPTAEAFIGPLRDRSARHHG